MTKTALSLVAVAALTLTAGNLPPPAVAAGLPAIPAAGPAYHKSGVIGDIDPTQTMVVIDDKGYSLVPGLPVNTIDGKSAGRGALRPGLPIGFKADYQNGRRVITEIWILRGEPK